MKTIKVLKPQGRQEYIFDNEIDIPPVLESAGYTTSDYIRIYNGKGRELYLFSPIKDGDVIDIKYYGSYDDISNDEERIAEKVIRISELWEVLHNRNAKADEQIFEVVWLLMDDDMVSYGDKWEIEREIIGTALEIMDKQKGTDFREIVRKEIKPINFINEASKEEEIDYYLEELLPEAERRTRPKKVYFIRPNSQRAEEYIFYLEITLADLLRRANIKMEHYSNWKPYRIDSSRKKKYKEIKLSDRLEKGDIITLMQEKMQTPQKDKNAI